MGELGLNMSAGVHVIHRCQNKTPDTKWDQGVWMTSCTGSVVWGFFGFEKKQWVEFLSLNERVEIQTWVRPDNFVPMGTSISIYVYFTYPYHGYATLPYIYIHTHTHTHTQIYIIYIYICKHIYRVQWVKCHLNYTKIKITLPYTFIKYIYQNFMKISWNTIDQIYSKKSPLVSTMATRWLQNLL